MKRIIRSGLLLLLDIILIIISVLAAYLLRFDFSFTKIDPHFQANLVKICLMAIVIKIPCFMFFRLYTSLWRYASIYEMISVIGAVFVGNAFMFSYIFLTQTAVPRSIFIMTIFIDLFLIGGTRFAYRIIRRLLAGDLFKSRDGKRVLIIGGGDAGAIVIKEMKLNPELKSIPVAVIDDEKSLEGRKINGVPIVGQRKDIVETVKDFKIEEIILAMPSANYQELARIYEECVKTKCKIKTLPSVSQLIDESVLVQKIKDVDIEDLLGRDPVSLDIDEISSYLEGKVVLVTGGGGSIGSELCRQIATFNPKQLIILDNYENNAFDIQHELTFDYPELDLHVVIASVREMHRIDSIFRRYRPNVVFHAAAHKHVPLMEANPTEAITNNVFGTQNVAECADKYHAQKFVLISTDKAVNPTNIMGSTKRIAELIIQAINKHSTTEFVAVRFGNVLGSNGSVIPLFKKQIQHGGPVTVTDPEVTRYFMTISEAVQLVLQAGAMAKGGEIFVLDMGHPVKIYDLAKNLIRLSGFEPETDIKIKFTGLRPGEKLHEELLLAEEGLQATKNNKIFVAQPVPTDFENIRTEIDRLKEMSMTDAEDVREQIKNIVPAFNDGT